MVCPPFCFDNGRAINDTVHQQPLWMVDPVGNKSFNGYCNPTIVQTGSAQCKSRIHKSAIENNRSNLVENKFCFWVSSGAFLACYRSCRVHTSLMPFSERSAQFLRRARQSALPEKKKGTTRGIRSSRKTIRLATLPLAAGCLWNFFAAVDMHQGAHCSSMSGTCKVRWWDTTYFDSNLRSFSTCQIITQALQSWLANPNKWITSTEIGSGRSSNWTMFQLFQLVFNLYKVLPCPIELTSRGAVLGSGWGKNSCKLSCPNLLNVEGWIVWVASHMPSDLHIEQLWSAYNYSCSHGNTLPATDSCQHQHWNVHKWRCSKNWGGVLTQNHRLLWIFS